MKLQWKITVAAVILGSMGVFLAGPYESREKKELDAARQTLRQQGFKIALNEFNFSAPAELHRRAIALSDASNFVGLLMAGPTWFMPQAGSNAAIVIWKADRLENSSSEDLWPSLRREFAAQRACLDAACQTALSGPFAFEPDDGRRPIDLRYLCLTLTARALLELHDELKDEAWTNVLAATRLVTAWNCEPSVAYRFHFDRCACAEIAYNAAWQVLQAGGWSDERLAALQREWETPDFFDFLPATVAFDGANQTESFARYREKLLSASRITAARIVRSPLGALRDFVGSRPLRSYFHHEFYLDERDFLLGYCEVESQLRRALKCDTWLSMQAVPGLTNAAVLLKSHYPPALDARLGLQYSLPQGLSNLIRPAKTEARRRLVITAIALERHRIRHGSYPNGLQDLTPDLLPVPAIDFMDGKPLRYRLLEDGGFILYSIGVDGVDNGGKMRLPGAMPGSLSEGTDLVWPRPVFSAEYDVETITQPDSGASQTLKKP